MGKCIVIAGGTGSGKSTLAKALVREGYRKVVTYTTRPKRPGEINGVDYHFITKEEFKKKFVQDFFAEVATYPAEFGHCMYGSAKEDYQAKDNTVIVLNPKGVIQIAESETFTLVYLDLSPVVLMERTKRRGDSVTEVQRRLADDRMKFDDMLKIRKPDIHVKKGQTLDALLKRVITHTDKVRGCKI